MAAQPSDLLTARNAGSSTLKARREVRRGAGELPGQANLPPGKPISARRRRLHGVMQTQRRNAEVCHGLSD